MPQVKGACRRAGLQATAPISTPRTCTTAHVAARSAASRSSSWLRYSAVTTRQCHGTMLNCSGVGVGGRRRVGVTPAMLEMAVGTPAHDSADTTLPVHVLQPRGHIQPSSPCSAAERAMLRGREGSGSSSSLEALCGRQWLLQLTCQATGDFANCFRGSRAATRAQSGQPLAPTHLPGLPPTAPGRTAGKGCATPSSPRLRQ